MSKNPLKFQANMEVTGGSRFRVSRTDESFKRMCMENYSVITRGAQIDNITQHDPLGEPYGEGDTDFVRGTGNFSKYGERFKFACTFRCLHFANGSWMDGPLDGRNDTLLYSSQNILWFFRIDRKSGSYPHREFPQSLWRKRCPADHPRHVKRSEGVWFYSTRRYRYGYNGSGGWDNTSYRDETSGSYDKKGNENTRDAKGLRHEWSQRYQGRCKKVFENIYRLSVLCQDKGKKEQGCEKSRALWQSNNEGNTTNKNWEQEAKEAFFKSSKRNFTIARTWSKVIGPNSILADNWKSSSQQDSFVMEKYTASDSKREDRQSRGIWKKMDYQLLSWRLCIACRSRECKGFRSALCYRIIGPSFRCFWRKPNDLWNRSRYVVGRKYISMPNGPGRKDRNTTKGKSESYGQSKRLQTAKKSSSRNRTTDWASKIAWSWQKSDEKRYWGSYQRASFRPFIQFSSPYEGYESTSSELENNIRKSKKLLIEYKKFN